jgi:predicted DNA-binding transcriptional regulator YafY
MDTNEPKPWQGTMDEDELTKIIKETAKHGKVLRIKYVNAKDENSIRNVEPYEIRNGKLWAYCRQKRGIRQFSMENIQSAKPTPYNYFPKWPVKLNEDALNKKASFDNPWDYHILEHLFGSYHNAEVE